ncbi:unnamed protein product [Closterium sp. NIES-65]|nr:unnamed protein product [Closterium sp. NIES-65]
MSGASVTMNVMLAVHCKRAVPLDLHRPLKAYIRSQYSDRHATDADDDLQLVQAWRREIEKGSSESLEARREVLLKYMRALTVMSSRFPIAPDTQHLNQINFTWFDAFASSKKASQTNIHFERAAIAFNIAATLSQIALAADRSTAAGLKAACNAFQAAAGAFAYLRDHISGKALAGGGTCTTDIAGETAGMLERLMLGQAQECFYEKALGEGKPNQICARIAQQVAMFYEEAHAALLLPPLSAHFDRQWVANVLFKARHFHAEALYRAALDLHAREEVAEEIARLTHAKALLAEARKGSKGVMQPLVDAVFKLEGHVLANLAKAEAENDRVYLYRVPAYVSLPPIAAAALVAATPLAPQLDATGERLLAGLVPDGSAKELSRYTDMVDGIIRNQVERMERESEEAKARLRELAVADVLVALDGDLSAFVPAKLRDDVEAVHVSGGPAGLPGELAQLHDLRRVNEELLLAAEETLQLEAADDAALRTQFGSRWARPQSSTLTKSLKERATAFAGNLKQAKESDARIERDLRDCSDLLGALGHSKVEDALPRISRPMLAVHGDDHALVATIRQLLAELERVGAQRAGVEEGLREMRARDNILPKLMNAPGSQEELFKKEASKYDALCQQVDANIAQQRSSMQQLEAQYQLFSQAFNIPEWKAEVGRAVKRMEAAVSKYQELRSNLNEGLKFYVALQDAITALKQQCSDYVMTRNMQKADLISDLQRHLAGLSLRDHTPPAAAAPAPRAAAPPAQVAAPAGGRSPGDGAYLGAPQGAAAAGGQGRPVSPKGGGGPLQFLQQHLPFFNNQNQQAPPQQPQPVAPAGAYAPPAAQPPQYAAPVPQQQQPPPQQQQHGGGQMGYYSQAGPPAPGGAAPAPYYMPAPQQAAAAPHGGYYSTGQPAPAPAPVYGQPPVQQGAQGQAQWSGGYHPQAYGSHAPQQMPPPNPYQYPPSGGY